MAAEVRNVGEVCSEEALIIGVERYPWLCNDRRLDYRDIVKRANPWHAIGIAVGEAQPEPPKKGPPASPTGTKSPKMADQTQERAAAPATPQDSPVAYHTRQHRRPPPVKEKSASPLSPGMRILSQLAAAQLSSLQRPPRTPGAQEGHSPAPHPRPQGLVPFGPWRLSSPSPERPPTIAIHRPPSPPIPAPSTTEDKQPEPLPATPPPHPAPPRAPAEKQHHIPDETSEPRATAPSTAPPSMSTDKPPRPPSPPNKQQRGPPPTPHRTAQCLPKGPATTLVAGPRKHPALKKKATGKTTGAGAKKNKERNAGERTSSSSADADSNEMNRIEATVATAKRFAGMADDCTGADEALEETRSTNIAANAPADHVNQRQQNNPPAPRKRINMPAGGLCCAFWTPGRLGRRK
ncbi:hypothetical protein HPB47_016328 [Ixodes persulcatus]|uniref:Uncharacterized protein n=1 Tax=Ixodes persulcatus TaxID=34615 RepID=A0AC60QRB1_IXOPE|nr:hypothetical protein HPB47_016328 [Ixodes persulcatus]